MSEQKQEAGRELDALIAERVMGIVPCDKWRKTNLGSAGGPALMKDDGDCPHERDKCYSVITTASIYGVIGGPRKYSTDIKAAWKVVERLRTDGWLVRVQEMPNEEPFLMGAGWRDEENLELHMRAMCQLYPSKRQREGRAMFRDIVAFEDSTPLAICKAALAAVNNK
jgi:hypothetical protein